jgi:hypothetical protein
MNDFASGAIPGFQAAQESEETQVTWSGRNGQTLAATRKAILASGNTDSGNTPTTTLRGGNLLAIDDATGEAYLYDPDASDGKQIAVGVLENAQDMLQNGTATDRFIQMLVHGLLKESQLQGLDPRARQQLASRFLFDKHVSQCGGELMHPRGVYRKNSHYTVLDTDNGLMFIATGAVNFTLPTKQNGLAFRFLQTADNTMAIIGSSDIIHKNSVASSSVTFSTSSEKIGSHVLVECVYTGTNTLKWLVTNLGGTTATLA